MKRIFTAILLLFFLALPFAASAQTTGDLLERINALSSQVAELSAQLTKLVGRVADLEALNRPQSALTISANSSAVRTVAVNVSNQDLGEFTLTVGRGGVVVASFPVVFGVKGGFSQGQISGIKIINANNVAVSGPFDVDASTGVAKMADKFMLAEGAHKFRVVGYVSGSIAPRTSIMVDTRPNEWKVYSATSGGNLISVAPSGPYLVIGTAVVQSPALNITVGSDIDKQVSPGQLNTSFGRIILDSSNSSEDLRIPAVYLSLRLSGGAGATSVYGCRLSDGATPLNTGLRAVNPLVYKLGQIAFVFDQSYVLPKGIYKTLTLSCSVSSDAKSGNAFQWYVSSSDSASVSVAGLKSGNAGIATGTGTGPTLTVSGSPTPTPTPTPPVVTTPPAPVLPDSALSATYTGAGPYPTLRLTCSEDSGKTFKIGTCTADAAILQWAKVDNATRCTASATPSAGSRWIGSKPLSGTETVETITSARGYTLECVGEGGTARQSVIVQPRAKPISFASTISLTAAALFALRMLSMAALW